MKKLLLILIILLCINSVQAQTVHKWEYELHNACVGYVSTNHTPYHLFNCLINESGNAFYYRNGWEKPVNADVMKPLTLYQPELTTLSKIEKQRVAEQYMQIMPQMYKQKMLKRKNLYQNFTETDVNRILGK